MVWNNEEIPTDWRRAVIVPIHKKRRDKMNCNNYRGIYPLCHCSNLFIYIYFTTEAKIMNRRNPFKRTSRI